MTMPFQRAAVVCPACETRYAASYRPSINLALGEVWTEEDMDRASSATCPSCGHVVRFESLRVSEDGQKWTFVK